MQRGRVGVGHGDRVVLHELADQPADEADVALVQVDGREVAVGVSVGDGHQLHADRRQRCQLRLRAQTVHHVEHDGDLALGTHGGRVGCAVDVFERQAVLVLESVDDVVLKDPDNRGGVVNPQDLVHVTGRRGCRRRQRSEEDEGGDGGDEETGGKAHVAAPSVSVLRGADSPGRTAHKYYYITNGIICQYTYACSDR